MLVTTVTLDRFSHFNIDAYAREAVDQLYRVQQKHPFFLYGFVIMPDHCHFLLKVLAPETISKVMNVYKSGLVTAIGVQKLWQARFHIRLLKNPQTALEYIHANPVRAGIVNSSWEYPWSSASGRWDVSPL